MIDKSLAQQMHVKYLFTKEIKRLSERDKKSRQTNIERESVEI